MIHYSLAIQQPMPSTLSLSFVVMYLLLSLLVAATMAAANPIPTPFRVEGVNTDPLAKRVLGTSTVNLNNNTGTPNHLASGVLYGIPDTPNQIPDVFYTDMGFNYARAGGAQVPAPGRGWIWGLSEYKVNKSNHCVRPNNIADDYSRFGLHLRCPTIEQHANTAPLLSSSFTTYVFYYAVSTILRRFSEIWRMTFPPRAKSGAIGSLYIIKL